MKKVLIKILTIFLLSFLLLSSVFASSTGSVHPSGQIENQGQRQPTGQGKTSKQTSTQTQLSSELPFVESGVLIPLGSIIYDKMDALFIMAGKGVPSTSRPWTVAQARKELLLINPSELFPEEAAQEKATQEELTKEKTTQELLQLYNELYAYLFTEDKNTLSLTATISPEAYLHTNTEYN